MKMKNTKTEISKTINIAIGCVMASGMSTDIKKEVIDSLRNIEEELIKISKEREMTEVSPLQAYPEHLVKIKKNEGDASGMSGEVNSCTGGPDQYVGYLGIDLASGESQTVRLVKKEIAKSFDINKGRLSLTAKNPQDNMVFECSTAQEAAEYKRKAEKQGYKAEVRRIGK